jgi:hypothetical protein
MLPELISAGGENPGLTKEFSSADSVMNLNDTVKLLEHHKVMVGDFDPTRGGELLR